MCSRGRELESQSYFRKQTNAPMTKVKAKGEEPSRLIGILSGDTSPPFEQDRPEMGGDGR